MLAQLVEQVGCSHFEINLTSGFLKTCYTARRIRLFASSGIDFQERFSRPAKSAELLALRQINAEADA